MPDRGLPPGMKERRSARSRLSRRFKRIPHPHVPHLSLTQVKVFRLFFLLFVVSILVLYGVFRSSRLQELLRRRSERLFSHELGRPVTIGRFDLALLPPAFQVKDITIGNDPRGLPGNCFSAEEISLRGIPAIFNGRIDLPKVRLVSPRIVFELFEDGSSNFDEPIRRLLHTGAKGGGPDVRLRELLIQKGTFRFREWDSKIDVLLEETTVTGKSLPFSKVTHAALACRKGRFRLESYEVLDFALGLEATLSPGRIHLDSFRLRSDRLTLDASGGVEDLKKPVVALVATAATTGEALEKLVGLKLDLRGGIALTGTVRIAEGEGFRIRGRFEMPEASLGPFPMAGSGDIRVDPGGMLLHLSHGEYAGGSLEATVRVERLKEPPLPVRIVVKGRGLDFERFLGDLDLKGTGLVGRADLDTTLTFGRHGSIDHADGAGSLRVNPAPGIASLVPGRHALPIGGGGPLLIRDGKILFVAFPLTTAGGAHFHLDGSLALDTWIPSITLDARAEDAAELERVADNLYPAIQKRKLTPALSLGGSMHLTGLLERSFGDPRISGHLDGSRFVLHGVPFGEVSADFVVDRNVLTLSPFRAADAGGTFTATGQIGWGGKLRDEYRLQGFVADFGRWPIERVMKLLNFDLPLTGPVTGRLPLEGVTPDVVGTVPLVWDEASLWGQKIDRLAGTLEFEKGRLNITGVKASIGQGSLAGGGWFRYADRGYKLDLTARELPIASLGAVVEGAPGLSGILDGELGGQGTVDRPDLKLIGTLKNAELEGKALGKSGVPVKVDLETKQGALSGTIEAPDAAKLTLSTEIASDRKEHLGLRLDVISFAPWARFLGIPADAGLDGTASLEAAIHSGAEGAGSATGALQSVALSIFGKKVSLEKGAGFRFENNRLVFDRLVLRGSEAAEAGRGPSGELRLAGSVGLTEPRTLDVTAAGSFDAALLRTLAPEAVINGRVAVDLRASGSVMKPLFSGKISLDGVDIAPSESATPFESITGTLTLVPGRVSTSALSLQYGGGTVDLDGNVSLDGIRPESIRVNAHLSHVRNQPFPGFRATVSGDLVLRGERSLRSAQGELTLERGLYDEDLSLSIGSLLGKLRPSSSLAPPPSSLDALTLDIKVNAPPGAVEVRNNVGRLRASGDLAVRGTFGRPILWGQLEAEEGGRLELRGIRYELVSGKILFSNATRIDPFYDLEARTTIRDYQITVGVTGTVARLAPQLSSDPPLSQSQIVSLITTGELPSSNTLGIPSGATPVSSDESIVSAARDLIAGLVTQAATERTKSFFRLDRLQIDPVFVGSSFDAPRLTLGKQVAKNLTVTYSYKASSNQEQVILVEYQLTPQAFLQFAKDETGVYSVDLKIRQRLR